jgi:hypothetical protein
MNEKTERILFYSFLSINIIPLFLHKYVASLDGPQHLYMSNVLVEIFKGDDEINRFFKLNEIIVGNWIGHFILSFFNLFLPGWLAEKILLITYFLGIAISFRYLLNSFPIKKSLISLLIVPFSSTSLLMMGYYNFSLAIIFFLVCFGYWIRNENNSKIKKYLIFSLLLIILYLSHVFIYTLFGFAFLIYYLIGLISETIYNQKVNSLIKYRLKEVIYLVIAFMPSAILWLIYSAAIRDLGEPVEVSQPSNSQLLYNMIHVKTLIGFHHQKEFIPTLILSLVIGILIVNLFFTILSKYHRGLFDFKKPNPGFYRVIWLFLSLSFMLMYFLFPNNFVSGNIKNRILIVFFFVLIIWLNLYHYNRWVRIVSAALILISLIWHRTVHYEFYRSLNREISELKEVEKYIDQNSIVFPLNFSENWIQKHFICYIGIDKPLVNLATPQCTGQFPIVWNNETRPDLFIGSYRVKKTGFFNIGEKKKAFVDYIVVWDKSGYERKTSKNELRENLVKLYELIYESSSSRAMLFKLKE